MQKNLALAQQKAQHIKLLTLDVDGVMTDGRLFFSEQGEIFKTFNILDGLGIKLLRATGVEVAIITGRKSAALSRRTEDLGIVHVWQGREDKLTALKELMAGFSVDYTEIAHLGDDLPDLPVMQTVGLGVAVANAYPFVAQQADWITTARGGEGAVREACDFIMNAQDTLQNQLNGYLS